MPQLRLHTSVSSSSGGDESRAARNRAQEGTEAAVSSRARQSSSVKAEVADGTSTQRATADTGSADIPAAVEDTPGLEETPHERELLAATE